MNKPKHKRGMRHDVGVLPYFFPSFFPSGFEIEAPLELEDTVDRLERLTRVRVDKSPSLGEQVGLALTWERTVVQTLLVEDSTPVEVHIYPDDPDTYRYRVNLRDNLFRITVRGYLKRWQDSTSLVTGKVQFDLHYGGMLLKSALFTGLLLVVLFLGAMLLWPLGFPAFPLTIVFGLMSGDSGVPLLLLFVVWLVVLALVWLTDVIAPANARRHRLVTRIEDTLLLSDLLS